MSFEESSRWTGAEGRLTAIFPESWAQGRATFGGILSAGALRAMQRHTPRRPRLVTTRFAAPVRPGVSAECDVEVLRVGSSLTELRARIRQGDRVCTEVLACFGDDRDSALQAAELPLPDGPPPGSGRPIGHIPGMTPAFLQHLDVRMAEGPAPFSSSAYHPIGGWIRFHGGSPGFEGVLALLDVFPPTVLPLASAPMPASSVQWTAYLLRPALESPEAWYRVRVEAESIGKGWTTERAYLWSEEGQLLGWCTQLVAYFGA